MKKTILTTVTALLLSSMSFAQFRATDQTGINVFETPKVETHFDGLKTTFGASISMPYIDLKESNNPDILGKNSAGYNSYLANGNPKNTQTLWQGSNNFGLSMANLYINTALADGIALQVTLYLASKHHNETWVKGGYVTMDKIPFIQSKLVDDIMKYTTIKVGQFDVNYGDAHFRRSDGGNGIYNVFMENYIMDEFATEIGAEADVNYKGLVAVASVTDGELNPDLTYIDTTTAKYKYSNGLHNPSWIAKLGYDKQLGDKFRVRLTGSVYYTAGAIANTLFGGDRTGSNYNVVMYNAAPGTGTAFNGRYNPGLTNKLTTGMVNLFLKYKPVDWLAIESFSTYEKAKGSTPAEAKQRNANQTATDLIFRFGKKENLFLGARYNTVSADVAASAASAPVAGQIVQAALPAYTIGINRLAISAGWFITKNLLTKVEYVNQEYTGVPDVNYIFNQAKFHGVTAEAVISF